MQRVEQGLEALEHVLPKLICMFSIILQHFVFVYLFQPAFAQTSFDGFTDGHREHITLLFMSIIPDLTDLISLIGMLVNDCKVINEMQANESEHKETPSHPDPRLRLASLILILVRGNPQLTRAALLAATHQCTKLASHLPSPAPLPTYFASPPSSSTETSPTIPSDWGVLCAANENYKARACIDSAYFCLHIIERIIATSTIDDLVISPLSSSQASRESQDLLDVFTPPTSTNNQDQPPDSKDTISQQLQSHIAHLLDASLNVYGAPPEYTEWVFRICLKLEGDRVRGQAWQRMEECVGSSQSKGDILE
ncbi:hypothetical protein DFS34DRAFT_641360 [Phlyctochytrium arcticum]|nr:hypothetical protein DFS34DRAFT_641360 [Phlyctochytrium arcticum]